MFHHLEEDQHIADDTQRQLLREATPEEKARKKLIAMLPGGKGRRVTADGAVWTKKGGFIAGTGTIRSGSRKKAKGGAFEQTRDKLKKAGFKQSSFRDTATQTGAVRKGNVWQDKAGNTIEFSSFFGVTAADNHHTIKLTFAPSKTEACCGSEGKKKTKKVKKRKGQYKETEARLDHLLASVKP